MVKSRKNESGHRKDLPIQSALQHKFIISNAKDSADPVDWVRRYRFHPQSVLYKVCLGLVDSSSQPRAFKQKERCDLESEKT